MSKLRLKRYKGTAFWGGAGAALGGLGYAINPVPIMLLWIVIGALSGVVIGLVWAPGKAFLLRHSLDEWTLAEVELQGLRFTSAGAQRRVAWRLFVEIVTRVSTQPIPTDDGDNGVALKSLYDLFRLAREEVAKMIPTPTASGNTVETFAIEMLNTDLRPFLSKWHPAWELFQKTEAGDGIWSRHHEFRAELAEVQIKLEARAKSMAQIAGVKSVDRFFPASRSN